jgi:glycolate oxidase iron-sulfur subunit
MGMLGATVEQLEEGKKYRSPSPSSPPRASLFTGCIMDGLFSHVHRATERALVANEVALAHVAGQGCCGALHAHTGQHEKALELARANVRAFSVIPDAQIVVNSAGCGAILKEYGVLLAGDPLEAEARAFSERVKDVSEVLVQCGPRTGETVRMRVAYDPPCHLLHAQRVDDAPLRVLQSIPGLELIGYADSDQCCGSAGSYSLTESALSRSVLERKIQALTDAGPDLVASGNPGCIMQIGAGLAARRSSVRVVHPVEILDLSYRRDAGYDG